MKKIAVLIFFMLCCVSSAYAAEISCSEDYDSGNIIVQGIIEEAEKNKMVSVEILDTENAAVYAKMLETDQNGSFSEELKVAGGMLTGGYVIKFGAYDLPEPVEYQFYYSNPDDIKNLINTLNEADDADAVQGVLEEHIAVLNLPDGYYEKLDGEGKLKIAQAVIADKPADGYSSFNEIKQNVYENLAIQTFSAASDTDMIKDAVSVFKDVYNFNAENTELVLYEEYAGFDTGEETEYMNLRMSEYTADTISDINKAFNESAFLTRISFIESPGEITAAIDRYRNDLEIDCGYYDKCDKSAIALFLAGKQFESISMLENEIKSGYDKQNTPGRPSHGGGSSGGSSGGSGTPDRGSTGISIIPDTDMENIGPAEEDVFSDLDRAEWAKEAILALNEKEIVSGDGDGRFRPNDSITREEFAVMLIKAFDLYDENSEVDFNDMDRNHWAYKYVASAYEREIISGIGNSEFGTGAKITRQDMAVMSCKAAEVSGMSFESLENDFSDGEEIARYALEPVSKMSGAGIISGYDDGRFAPRDNATRAQAARIIYLLISRLEG